MENLETKIDKIFGDINNWFKVNQLILNYNKIHYLQFNTKNSWDYDLKLNYQGNYVKSSSNTKFWGLIIDDSLSWKAHIDQIMSKLNTACFVIRMIQAIMSPETLRMVYFAYIHSIMSYGIILGGINHIVIRFSKFKKRVIRILTNSRMRDSFTEPLKKLEILPSYSQYIFSISVFVIKRKHLLYTIRSIVFTQDLKPTYIHLQLIQQSSKRQCTTQQLKFVTIFLTISKT